jgi:hypothetical protein
MSSTVGNILLALGLLFEFANVAGAVFAFSRGERGYSTVVLIPLILVVTGLLLSDLGFVGDRRYLLIPAAVALHGVCSCLLPWYVIPWVLRRSTSLPRE